MNRNAIISLAMLYALWQTKHRDLLDLIRPFIVYAVGMNTSVGEEIDIERICRYMESEFGYQSFHPAVAERVLIRETSDSIPQEKRIVQKKNKKYYLLTSLTKEIQYFSDKRVVCKGHSDKVTMALADYLNQKQACKRSDFSQTDAENLLLAFFERQGGSIVLSVEDLHQLTIKNNEVDFFVGKFILEQNEKKSIIMDYLVELVKGYFVTTALYLQAENTDVTKASFSDVTFFIDTRLLLAYLGFKTSQENSSVQEMIRSLKKNGAKFACFSYNIEEVNNILEAYKQSTISTSKRPTTITLEYFDEHGYSYTHVEAAQRKFEKRLKGDNIIATTPEQLLAENGITKETIGLLDDDDFRTTLLNAKPNYNLSTLPDDFSAINTISRIRKGKFLPYIEKCRAVFVTTNPILVSTTKQVLKNHSYNVGFPIAITGNDLCVMAWLKDFEQSSSLPKMRLLENVLAAITPSKELMEAYFSNLENLEQQGKISSDEAALLRVDHFAKKELMELTQGEKNNLSSSVFDKIREKIREDGFKDGIQVTTKEHEKWLASKRNEMCRQAEEDVEDEYQRKENFWIRVAKCIAIGIAVLFIIASACSFFLQWNSKTRYFLLIVTFITTIQGAAPFFSENNWLIKFIHRGIQKRKYKALDIRKEKYLKLLERK